MVEAGARSAVDRFSEPLYTVAEAARFLGVSPSTLASWSRGYRRRGRGDRPDVVGAPILSAVGDASPPGTPTIPFIGLAEGAVLSAIRGSGVPLQRIRPALAALSHEMGVEHALASRRLYTDGAELLFDHATVCTDSGMSDAAHELVVVRNGQRVFNDVVDAYLRRVEFGSDGYARLVRLPAYRQADIIADPSRGFGQPVFARGGARLEDVLAMFRSGESIDVVAEEYGVPRDAVEDAVRVATRAAA